MKRILIIASLLILCSCSSARVMKDCKPLAENYFECYKP